MASSTNLTAKYLLVMTKVLDPPKCPICGDPTSVPWR